jgi:hypothetical protein
MLGCIQTRTTRIFQGTPPRVLSTPGHTGITHSAPKQGSDNMLRPLFRPSCAYRGFVCAQGMSLGVYSYIGRQASNFRC